MENNSLEANYLLQFINQTQRHVFLTGKAGTGKTTLLRQIIQQTHKNTVVAAPTGIAALNAQGVTIHSLFQLPFGGFLPIDQQPFYGENLKFETRLSLGRQFKMSQLKQNVLQNMELLIIDEVSMLRADLLDAIDFVLRNTRKNNQPFGGVQLLFIGDLQQLPPVVKEEEWRVLRDYYPGKFFFNAQVLRQHPPLYIELPKIFRQTDTQFIRLLNNLRNNQLEPEDLSLLDSHVRPGFDLKDHPGQILLTTHNSRADRVNQKALDDLSTPAYVFSAEVTGDFPEKIYPLEPALTLKKGAQVMFIKNDTAAQKQFYNGKMGVVASLSPVEIKILFPDEHKTIAIEKYEWENIRYNLNPDNQDIEQEVLGTFVQYPIKPAWAITVHKSQGLTFDRAVLDVSEVFLPGQAYVALSRLRSLEGLVLLSPLRMNGMANDQEVMQYATNLTAESEMAQTLSQETAAYLIHYLTEAFDWQGWCTAWQTQLEGFKPKKVTQSKLYNWAIEKTLLLKDLAIHAYKFTQHLQQLFRQKAELDHLATRIDAAYDFFFPVLDRMEGELLLQMETIRQLKKTKALYEALSMLEQLQIRHIHKLMKARLMIHVLLQNRPFTKENLSSDRLKNYRQHKMEEIQKELKDNPVDLVTVGLEPKQAKKKEKKHTTLQTLELWQQRLSIAEIASRRKLTISTISSHLAQLIESETIRITDLMPEDKIEELAQLFKGFKGDTLSEIKEKCGERFSWDELRLYRASL